MTPRSGYTTVFDLQAIARQLLAEDATAEEIVYAMEKPWKHRDVLDRAIASEAGVEHILYDGLCRVSVNGRGQLPCAAHVEATR